MRSSKQYQILPLSAPWTATHQELQHDNYQITFITNIRSTEPWTGIEIKSKSALFRFCEERKVRSREPTVNVASLGNSETVIVGQLHLYKPGTFSELRHHYLGLDSSNLTHPSVHRSYLERGPNCLLLLTQPCDYYICSICIPGHAQLWQSNVNCTKCCLSWKLAAG